MRRPAGDCPDPSFISVMRMRSVPSGDPTGSVKSPSSIATASTVFESNALYPPSSTSSPRTLKRGGMSVAR